MSFKVLPIAGKFRPSPESQNRAVEALRGCEPIECDKWLLGYKYVFDEAGADCLSRADSSQVATNA